MSEQSHLLADLGHDDQFEREMRGYNRREVDEAIAALRISARSLEDGKRDLETRLSQALDEGERLKLELSTARSAGKPPHEEVSERVGQILKLAADEATSLRAQAEDEIAKQRAGAEAETGKLRADAKTETERTRAEAHEQAERMLSAAQEQADSTLAAAKSEAESLRKGAATDAQQVLSEATKQAESAVSTAKSQAKQQLDEATARATAIHDGAERRLNLLMSRHTEAIRRLTEIRDVVTTLVAGETDRGSLEDEVAKAVAGALAANDGQPNGRGPAAQPANGRPGGPSEGRHAGGPVQATSPGGIGAQGNGAPQASGNGGQHADARHAPPVPGPRMPVQAPEGDDTADGINIVRD